MTWILTFKSGIVFKGKTKGDNQGCRNWLLAHGLSVQFLWRCMQ